MAVIEDRGAAAANLPDALNLGCGEDVREGWHNVDIAAAVEPDQVHDLDESPWPLPSDHFSRINARHVLEHLTAPIQALEEMCRVATPGATLTVVYPLGHTRYEDPTHEQFWNWHTAGVLAGERSHSHEVNLPLRLVEREPEWWLSHADPMTRAYVRGRLAMASPGPWLEQVPGMYGEMAAHYRYDPDDDVDEPDWDRYRRDLW